MIFKIKSRVYTMCLQRLWSRLKTTSTNKVKPSSIKKEIHYNHSFLWGKWVFVSASNLAAFNKIMMISEQLPSTHVLTEKDEVILNVTYNEETDEWSLAYESRFGVIVNRFLMNEDVRELTASRIRIDSCINTLVDMNTIFSCNTMKSGQKWTALRCVDPRFPNTMTYTMIANGTRAIITYKRLNTESNDVTN